MNFLSSNFLAKFAFFRNCASLCFACPETTWRVFMASLTRCRAVSWMSAFRNFVLCICFISPNEKMGRVYASRVVAFVANKLSIKNFSFKCSVTKPVRKSMSAVVCHSTVPCRSLQSSPLNTIGALFFGASFGKTGSGIGSAREYVFNFLWRLAFSFVDIVRLAKPADNCRSSTICNCAYHSYILCQH